MLLRLVAEQEDLARVKSIAISAAATEARVRCDAVLLGRILQNFLTNAVRYTERGSIRVRCLQSAAELRIEVADTGPGISESRHQDIFQEFVRIDQDAGDGGLGLGLSIAARMARLLGHDLSLESAPGSGSTFAITVQRSSRVGPSHSPSPIDFGGRMVWVIDDDSAVLEGTGRLLQQWGCEVQVARSLAEALAICSASSRVPDLILVDYRLGKAETGLEALQRLNERFEKCVPAAVVTGETTRAVLDAIHASGFVHLTKPVAPFKLRATLMELLRPGLV
jgi:CheY-like chemotaxis protein/anti-sigma regulatory factor (Ser/Thr protein kinase)